MPVGPTQYGRRIGRGSRNILDGPIETCGARARSSKGKCECFPIACLAESKSYHAAPDINVDES